jgi:lipopolysaccharide export LptBFGC system permease protein LptF
VLTLINNGYVEPLAERRYTELVDSFYYTRPRTETQENVAFSMPDGSIYYAAEIRGDTVDPEQAELRGVLLLLPDGTTVTAALGTWFSIEREWLLTDVQRAPVTGAPVEADSLIIPFDFAGSPAATLTREEQLTLGQLRERIANVRKAGGQVRPLEYELQRRAADAFSAACFVLVASLLGLGVRARSTAFAWTIGLLVAFYALWMLSGSLFDRNVLSAVWAAWLTPLLVTAAGTLLAAWRLRR